jgi:hypothetical protein
MFNQVWMTIPLMYDSWCLAIDTESAVGQYFDGIGVRQANGGNAIAIFLLDVR